MRCAPAHGGAPRLYARFVPWVKGSHNHCSRFAAYKPRITATVNVCLRGFAMRSAIGVCSAPKAQSNFSLEQRPRNKYIARVISWGVTPGYTMSRAFGAKQKSSVWSSNSRAFLLPKRVNDKQHYRNRDARIGDVKRRPGIGVADVEIKKEKVNHVSVKQAICEISQNPGKEKRE